MNVNRLNRKSYAVALLLSGLLVVFGFQLDYLLYAFTGTDFDSNKFGMPFLLISLIASVAYSAIAGVKRLHDINENGWWLLFAIIPLLGLPIALPMLFKKGTDDSNKYGKPVEDLFIIGWSSAPKHKPKKKPSKTTRG